ncbi:MAG: 4-hydroxy-tetrahydrodipicolinate synthase [Sphingobacteriales bacterium]|nr:MAG: 4-hydroxy-tetrahydrodipicolinate synthase [Sphingobacteriales bacterium]
MFQGSMVALVTPMKADNSLDWDALHKLVDWHLQEGTRALVPMGTTGESPTLDYKEHMDVVAAVVDQVNGRVPVIAGTGSNSTSEAIELTQAAKDLNADGCLLITPYYNRPTQEGLYLHHKAIAEAVAIPQILYNVPGRTGVDMTPATVARLSLVPNIVGIKEATGDLSRITAMKNTCPDSFIVLSGDDASAIAAMELGAKGEISVTANVAPKAVAQMCQAALDGDFARAQAINLTIAPLHRLLFVEANPIPVKWALNQMGRIDSGIRLPLTPFSVEHHSILRDALQAAGIL